MRPRSAAEEARKYSGQLGPIRGVSHEETTALRPATWEADTLPAELLPLGRHGLKGPCPRMLAPRRLPFQPPQSRAGAGRPAAREPVPLQTSGAAGNVLEDRGAQGQRSAERRDDKDRGFATAGTGQPRTR
jgi:hypothetical protein